MIIFQIETNYGLWSSVLNSNLNIWIKMTQNNFFYAKSFNLIELTIEVFTIFYHRQSAIFKTNSGVYWQNKVFQGI